MLIPLLKLRDLLSLEIHQVEPREQARTNDVDALGYKKPVFTYLNVINCVQENGERKGSWIE